MKRWAVISDGIVKNIVAWDGESNWSPPNESDLVIEIYDLPVAIGWTYNGSEFINPNPVIE